MRTSGGFAAPGEVLLESTKNWFGPQKKLKLKPTDRTGKAL